VVVVQPWRILVKTNIASNPKSPEPFNRLLLLLAALPLLAIGNELFIAPLLKGSIFATLDEHVSIALWVSFTIGFIFETSREMLFQRRIQQIKQIVERALRREIGTLFNGLGILSPKEILGLIREIILMQDRLPTLYEPARHETEYLFVRELAYLERLIPAARPIVVEMLREWIRPESPNPLKFFASDVIGRFGIVELCEDLLTYAEPRVRRLQDEEAEDRGWLMNYLWAASKCERPAYSSLASYLLTTTSVIVEEWILFVPQQMPDEEFVTILDDYLAKYRSQKKPVPEVCMDLVIKGLAALTANGINTIAVFAANRELLRPECARIESTWRAYNLPPDAVIKTLDQNGWIPSLSKLASMVTSFLL